MRATEVFLVRNCHESHNGGGQQVLAVILAQGFRFFVAFFSLLKYADRSLIVSFLKPRGIPGHVG